MLKATIHYRQNKSGHWATMLNSAKIYYSEVEMNRGHNSVKMLVRVMGFG